MGTVKRIEAAIAVVGAGIAGLACAIALARRGREVVLIEAFDQPSEVGAGLQVSPNASHVIDRLGLLGALSAQSVKPGSLSLADAVTGDTVLDLPVNTEPGALPYLTTHRAILHDTLFVAMRTDVRIMPLLGHRVVDVEEKDASVTLTASHHGDRVAIEAQCVIGADGIWSVLRNAVPDAAAPEPTGRIALRAVVDTDASSTPADRVVAWMAPSAHLVTYPVRNSHTRNLVAVTSGEAGEESWAQGVQLKALDRLIAALKHTPYADMVGQVDWTLWPLYAVAPGAAWHSRRLCLIGDAAHGIEPFAAQGAAMAIEDGYELAALVDQYADRPHRAFQDFRAKRRRRVERVARRTDFNRFAYHQSGVGRLVRNAVFKRRRPESFLQSLDWLYGYRA